jgi:hypothetical protein
MMVVWEFCPGQAPESSLTVPWQPWMEKIHHLKRPFAGSVKKGWSKWKRYRRKSLNPKKGFRRWKAGHFWNGPWRLPTTNLCSFFQGKPLFGNRKRKIFKSWFGWIQRVMDIPLSSYRINPGRVKRGCWICQFSEMAISAISYLLKTASAYTEKSPGRRLLPCDGGPFHFSTSSLRARIISMCW